MPPTITGIYPRKGTIGSGVRISGTSLNTVTEVYFNFTRANTVVHMGGKTIRATVPRGATSGHIKVVDDKGAEAVSSSEFVVEELAARRVTHLLAEDLDPNETAIVAAWNNLFVAGPDNLPAMTKKDFDPVPLGSIDCGSVKKGSVDICEVPNDPYSPIGKDAARLELIKLSLCGLGSMTKGAAPVFHDNGAQVVFSVNLGTVKVDGRFKLTQECCIPTIIGCGSAYAQEYDDSLEYSVGSAVMTFAADVSTDPLALTVSAVSFDLNGTAHVSLGGDRSSWHWLDYLTGVITTEDAIRSALGRSINTELSGSNMKAVVQKLINAELGK